MMRPTTTNAFDVNAFFVAVGSERRITHYRKRQIIFSQGDESDSIFYIEKGHVKLSVVSAEGKEAIVSVCDGGSFFGESCIESDCPVRFHSVVALTKVDLVRIERAAILHLLNAGGPEALRFISFVLRRNARIQEEFANSLVEPSEERLARILLSLDRFRREEDGESVPRFSQQAMAEMIGISRQQVNVLMKRFKKGSLLPARQAREFKSLGTTSRTSSLKNWQPCITTSNSREKP